MTKNDVWLKSPAENLMALKWGSLVQYSFSDVDL